MTLKDFTFYNETKSMPVEWIGQGYGYKETEKEWNDIDDDEIIYIPEYGYNDDHTVSRNDAYTKSDFIKLTSDFMNTTDKTVQSEDIEQLAMELFDAVDWQYPESLIDEGFFEEE